MRGPVYLLVVLFPFFGWSRLLCVVMFSICVVLFSICVVLFLFFGAVMFTSSVVLFSVCVVLFIFFAVLFAFLGGHV